VSYKVLICDPIAEEAIDILKKRGLIVERAESPSPEVLARIIKGYHVIIVRSATKVTREVIDAGKNLTIIARAGSGLDNIDVDYARSRGIKVINAPEALSTAVAELVFGLILCLARQIHIGWSGLKRGEWLKKKLLGFELKGKTLGVIGLGNIGSEVCRIAKGFGMRVVGFRRHKMEETCRKLGITPAKSLDELLKISDIITIHVPLTKETYHMINDEKFKLMKRGVYLINTSRAEVIDGKALLLALERGIVAGAALDVFTKEPPTEEWEIKLINHPRVIATPHIGSMTREAQRKAGVIIANKIIELIKA